MARIKVELTIPSDLKDEPLLYQIGHKFKVIPNIIEASFSTEMGWVLLTIEGEEEEIEKLFDYLKTKNVKIEQKHTI